MRVKRLVLCVLLSVALTVTFIPVMSYADVDYYDDEGDSIGEEAAPWTISQQINSENTDGIEILEGEEVTLTVVPDDSQLQLTYTWYYCPRNEMDFTEIDGVSGKTCDVSSVGIYLCEVSDTEGNCANVYFYVSYKENDFTDFADIVDDAVPVSLNTKKTIDNNEGMFAFTPKVSGTYAFRSYSDANVDSMGQVLDSEGNFIADSDDISNENRNFSVIFDAVAGKTYYLQAISYYKEQVVFSVSVVEAAHKWTHVASPGGYLVNGVEYDKCDICGAIVNQKVVPGWATSYVKGMKIAKGKGKITVKWKKQSKKNLKKFSGYQIRYSTSADMSGAKYVNVGKKSKSKKIGKLAKKTKYYVQMRSYTGGFYSGWSAVKSVKTK